MVVENDIYSYNTRQERFLAAVDSLKLEFPVAEISQKTNYGKPTVSKYLKATGKASAEFIETFCEQFGFDKDKLKDGVKPPEKDIKRVPIVGEAIAGTDMEMVYHDNPHEMEYIDVGDLLRDSQAAFTVYGNSMTPNYPSGCIIGIKSNPDGFIQPGEIYLVETKGNRIFKRLFYNDDNTGYICYSDNVHQFTEGPMKGKFFYPPFEVKFKDVIRLFDVTGMIKRTRNSGIMNRQK